MTGTARGQRLEEVDKESDGKDCSKQEVNLIANHRALPAVYRTIDARAKDERQCNQPENIPRRMERTIDGGGPVKRRG
jgi:hypothetical protein